MKERNYGVVNLPIREMPRKLRNGKMLTEFEDHLKIPYLYIGTIPHYPLSVILMYLGYRAKNPIRYQIRQCCYGGVVFVTWEDISDWANWYKYFYLVRDLHQKFLSYIQSHPSPIARRLLTEVDEIPHIEYFQNRKNAADVNPAPDTKYRVIDTKIDGVSCLTMKVVDGKPVLSYKVVETRVYGCNLNRTVKQVKVTRTETNSKTISGLFGMSAKRQKIPTLTEATSKVFDSR